MPSLSLHIYAGYLLNPAGSQVYFTGLIAPDAVEPWQKKEHAHLRDRADRLDALHALSDRALPGDDFALATLFHLFCDYIWDTSALQGYKDRHGEDWFLPYRGETAKASSFLYASHPELARCWTLADTCPPDAYAASAYRVDGDIPPFIHRNYLTQRDRRIGPSEVYPPAYVEEYCRYAAEVFPRWRENPQYTIFYPFP